MGRKCRYKRDGEQRVRGEREMEGKYEKRRGKETVKREGKKRSGGGKEGRVREIEGQYEKRGGEEY